MQQAVRRLRTAAALAGAAAVRQPDEAEPDAALAGKVIPEATAWTGPPHGTFLSYALLQWAAAAPAAAGGTTATAAAAEAAALLTRLSVSCDVTHNVPNDSTKTECSPSSPFTFLPHPLLMVAQQQPHRQQHPLQHYQGQQEQRQEQPEQRLQSQVDAIAAVRRLHVLQRQRLQSEHLLHCREVLEQLLQLLQTCSGATHPHLLGLPPLKNDGNGKTREGLRAAAAQSLRLAAFILGADKRMHLCGVWALPKPPSRRCPAHQKEASRCKENANPESFPSRDWRSVDRPIIRGSSLHT